MHKKATKPLITFFLISVKTKVNEKREKNIVLNLMFYDTLTPLTIIQTASFSIFNRKISFVKSKPTKLCWVSFRYLLRTPRKKHIES